MRFAHYCHTRLFSFFLQPQALLLQPHCSAPHAHIQLLSCLILTIVGMRVRFLRWKTKNRESDALSYAAHDFSSAPQGRSVLGGAVAHDGGWPQDRFASLSIAAGLTGVVDAVLMGWLFRNAKYIAFSSFYSSSYVDALREVRFASTYVSGAAWVAAFNTIALNFAQLILIERMIGALSLATRLSAVDRLGELELGPIKWLLRCPRPLYYIIATGGAISVAARTVDFILSIVVSRAVQQTLPDLNVSSVVVMQVWGLGFRV